MARVKGSIVLNSWHAAYAHFAKDMPPKNPGGPLIITPNMPGYDALKAGILPDQPGFSANAPAKEQSHEERFALVAAALKAGEDVKVAKRSHAEAVKAAELASVAVDTARAAEQRAVLALEFLEVGRSVLVAGETWIRVSKYELVKTADPVESFGAPPVKRAAKAVKAAK